MSWKVTVRIGPEVSREKHARLDDALAAAREHADRARRGERLRTAKAFRDYAPGEQVRARIEISGKGLVRAPEGGIDVRGDGAIVAYSGAIRKRPLAAEGLDDAIEVLRAELER